MKNFFKSKKVLILLGVVLIGVLICILSFTMKKEEQSKNALEKNYVAYIKINPFVKIAFSVLYNCDDLTTCDDFTSKVTGFSLLNEDAKKLYEDIDYQDKSLEDIISLLIFKASENNIDTSNIVVTTDWDNSKFFSSLAGKEKTEFKINYLEDINEEELIKRYEQTYTITFDSDGGSSVESQTILENKTIAKPIDPIRDGYTFVEWQLDGKTYDFTSIVTNNITLKAKWQKNKEQTNTTTSSASSSDNNTSSTKKENELSQKEKDNAILKSKLKEQGLTWDFNTESEAYNLLDKWSGGYGGEVLKNSYGESDIAYSVKITLNTAACGGKEILNIDWHNNSPVDFIYYLHSKGYNCAGNVGYYNGKHFTINQNNELVFD